MTEIPNAEELHKAIRQDADYLILELRNSTPADWQDFSRKFEVWIQHSAEKWADFHFKKHGAEYVRNLTLETINRLFHLEGEP